MSTNDTNIRTTITASPEAMKKLEELQPNQKATETIRNILEAIVYFDGSIYDLLHTIAGNRSKEKD